MDVCGTGRPPFQHYSQTGQTLSMRDDSSSTSTSSSTTTSSGVSLTSELSEITLCSSGPAFSPRLTSSSHPDFQKTVMVPDPVKTMETTPVTDHRLEEGSKNSSPKPKQRSSPALFNVFLAVLNSVFKYRSAKDKQTLELLQTRLRNVYGDKAEFKNATVLMKYYNKLEDYNIAADSDQLIIEKEDVAVPDETRHYPEIEPQQIAIKIENKKTISSPKPQTRPAWTGGTIDPELRCKVCLDQPISQTFVPCGHLVTCSNCAEAFEKCCVCRADIYGRVHTYY